jgi:hypothetical protein
VHRRNNKETKMVAKFACPHCGIELEVGVSQRPHAGSTGAEHQNGEAELDRALADGYRAGETAPELAKRFGCGTDAVYYALRRLDVKRRHRGRGKKEPGAREIDMAELYRGGATLQGIGDKYGITRERVRQLLAKIPGGVSSPRKPGGLTLMERNPELVRTIIERFTTSSLPSSIIASELGISDATARRVLRAAGVFERRPNPYIKKRNRPLADDAEMVRLYEQKDTPVVELARIFGFKNEASCRMALLRLGARRRFASRDYTEMVRLYTETAIPVRELAQKFSYDTEGACRQKLMKLGAYRRKQAVAAGRDGNARARRATGDAPA